MESTMKTNQKMMFNSEVELGKFLGSTDVIQVAYQAILDTSSTYKFHTNSSGFKILAFDSFPDYTLRFRTGDFDLVSLENHKLNFISTKVNPEISINQGAVKLFDQVFVELSELLKQEITSPLIVTGQGLGGYLAILYALWHQNAVDVEESKDSKTEKKSKDSKRAKRPICKTFGSPLLGDEPMRRAILERPQWKSCFLNVVAKKDALASFFSSNDLLYKPFGNFLFCTESGGHTSFDDDAAIMVLLDAMVSSNAGNISQLAHDYNEDLCSIRRKILYGGASKLGEFNLNKKPLTADKIPLRAGIVVQLQGIGLLNDNSHNLIADNETSRENIIKKKRMENAYEPSKKLNDMKMSLTVMEWYMKSGRSQGGYYDMYRLDAKSRTGIESRTGITKDIRSLKQYWEKIVREKDQMPQKEGAKLRKRWLYGGTNYRRIVEPLYIAEHYKNGNKDYMAVRDNHYKLLEKWSEDDKKAQNKPSDEKTKAASLTEDSCFWAQVEEALILLTNMKNGEPNSIATEMIEKFEAYVLREIKSFSVSPEVFLEGSSLMKWWREYKAYKEDTYNSEFARYMNSGDYKLYK